MAFDKFILSNINYLKTCPDLFTVVISNNKNIFFLRNILFINFDEFIDVKALSLKFKQS